MEKFEDISEADFSGAARLAGFDLSSEELADLRVSYGYLREWLDRLNGDWNFSDEPAVSLVLEGSARE